MGKLTAKANRLLAAAEAYGDAKVAQDRAVREWSRGVDLTPVNSAVRIAENDLHQAARSYATSTRQRRSTLQEDA